MSEYLSPALAALCVVASLAVAWGGVKHQVKSVNEHLERIDARLQDLERLVWQWVGALSKRKGTPPPL